MGTSRVRLLSTGASTMALKPPFSSFYCCPGLSGFEASPWRHSLHGLSYPWVSGSNTVVALLFYLGDTCSRRSLILATLPLGDALPWRRLPLALPHLGSALCWLGPRHWLWTWLCQCSGMGRYIYTPTIQFLSKLLALVALQAHAPINCDNISKISVQLPPVVAPECTLFCVIYLFFFYFAFSTDYFCLLLLTLQTTEIQNLIIFIWRI